MKVKLIKILEKMYLEVMMISKDNGWVEITNRSTDGVGGYDMITKRTVREAEAEEIKMRLLRKGYMAINVM